MSHLEMLVFVFNNVIGAYTSASVWYSLGIAQQTFGPGDERTFVVGEKCSHFRRVYEY